MEMRLEQGPWRFCRHEGAMQSMARKVKLEFSLFVIYRTDPSELPMIGSASEDLPCVADRKRGQSSYRRRCEFPYLAHERHL